MRVVVAGLLAWGVLRWVVLPVWIDGESMAPTVRTNRVRLVNLLAWRFRDPQRGEVVVIRMAGRRVMYLKRVLAVPGETVAFEAGALLVGGTRMEEPYVVYQGAWTMPPLLLGPEEFFVAGDNRAQPMEAHKAGVVRRERMEGVLLL